MTHEPSPEFLAKLQKAKEAIVTRKQRQIKCPYCDHTAMTVYSNSSGFVETKCKKCHKSIVIDLLNMRKSKIS